jgi:type IV pilus assembly protein PilB
MLTTNGASENPHGQEKSEKIGEILVKKSLVTHAQLDQALQLQRETGGRLGSCIVKLGFLTGDEITAVLSLQCGIPSVNLAGFLADPSLVRLIPMATALKFQVLPLSCVGSSLTLAMADPSNLSIIEEIKVLSGFNIEPVVASQASLEKAIRLNYGSAEEEEHRRELMELATLVEDGEAKSAIPGGPSSVKVGAWEEAAAEALVNKLIDYILADALGREASDIHLEPCGKQYKIRYRIDGVLQSPDQFPVQIRKGVISQIKSMAKLDASEKQLPQQGRARAQLLQRGITKELHFRVSVIPTLEGEKLVLRLLDEGTFRLDFTALGLEPADREKFENALLRPYGMVLVTGPPGSGKTTTLYSSLSRLNKPGLNLLTAENPVQFPLPGINQVQIVEQAGLNYTAAIHSFLWQDADVIMVGELRDPGTAELAFEAALTGHLVLSALFADDTTSALCHLIGMGLDPFLVGTSVHAICAQRVVQRICQQCRSEHSVSHDVLLDSGFTLEEAETVKLFRGVGCDTCNKRGYKGHVGIYEILEMTTGLRELVLKRASPMDLRKRAVEEGMLSLRRSGLLKVAAGMTTLEEILRKTGP